MGVTVTQSREVPGPQCETQGYTLSGGSWVRTHYEVQDPGVDRGASQTTTSYRSWSPDGDVLDPDDALLHARTRGQQFAALRKEYSEQASSELDTGHPFETVKKEWFAEPEVFISNGGSWFWWYYNGVVGTVPSQHNIPGSTFIDPPAFDPAEYGPVAIDQTRPNAPSANLVGTLLEIKREGLPRLPSLSILRDMGSNPSRAIGSEYLNHEFGWKPLVADVKALARSAANSERIIRQFERDSGRIVRRKFRFPVEETVTKYPAKQVDLWPGSSTNGVTPFRRDLDGGFYTAAKGEMVETVTMSRTVWFSGAYRYHLATGRIPGGMGSWVRKADHLLGLELTPEVLWNLTPWTWLFDWNGNIGNQISNLTSFSKDSLVLLWGYLMCTDVCTREISVTTPGWTAYPHNGSTPGNGFRGPYTQRFVTTSKRRVRAQPYGFSLDVGSYSARQWAILGALGLTRGPQSLARTD